MSAEKRALDDCWEEAVRHLQQEPKPGLLRTFNSCCLAPVIALIVIIALIVWFS